MIGNNPEKINESYFELVDYVIDKAEELGMYWLAPNLGRQI